MQPIVGQTRSANDEPVAVDDSPISIGIGSANIGPRVGERVELAALAARIDRGRQFVEQRRVELAAGEAIGSSTRRVDAGHARAQPPAIISRASVACRQPNSGKSGVRPRAGEPLLAVTPDVLEEQIAERDVREALGDRARDSRAPCARS